MDGTIYLGTNILKGVKELFFKLRNSDKSYFFLTNNSSRDGLYYKEKLALMGIDSSNEQIIISTHSAIYYLQQKNCKKIFVLGTAQLKNALRKAGFRVVSDGGLAIDYVVVGFDTELDYQDLTYACQYIDQKIPYLATHPDVRCPVEGGRYVPDCGSIVALLKTATGVDCSEITGKPSKYMIDVVMQKTGFKPEEIAIIGDRLYTDIAMGKFHNILSILVLTGETTIEDLQDSEIKPDIVLDGIYQLEEYI